MNKCSKNNKSKTNNSIWDEYKKDKTIKLKNTLCKQYLPLIKYVLKISNIPKNGFYNYDDLYQFGFEGLNQAIERFDPEVGTKFETYGILRIRGRIIDELRKIKKYDIISLNNLKKVNISDEKKYYVDLDEVFLSDETLLDDSLINKEDIRILNSEITKLNKREKKIIKLYYYKNYRLEEIANDLCLTKGRVCQIHRKALTEIKEKLILI